MNSAETVAAFNALPRNPNSPFRPCSKPLVLLPSTRTSSSTGSPRFHHKSSGTIYPHRGSHRSIPTASILTRKRHSGSMGLTQSLSEIGIGSSQAVELEYGWCNPCGCGRECLYAVGVFGWVGSDQDWERGGEGYFERELEYAVGLCNAARYCYY